MLDSQSAFWALFKRRQRHQRKDVSNNSVLTRNGNGSYGTELRQRYNGTAERHNGTAKRQRQNGNGSTATEGWKPGITVRKRHCGTFSTNTMAQCRQRLQTLQLTSLTGAATQCSVTVRCACVVRCKTSVYFNKHRCFRDAYLSDLPNSLLTHRSVLLPTS